MAESSKLSLNINDITECPICTNSYTDPKVLPCIHTFCLKCLNQWGKDKQSGDQVSCPFCRKEFVIPVGGLEALPTNFFITKLLDVKEITMSKIKDIANYCDACSDIREEKEIATMYCINCEQYLCTFCGNCHLKLKSSKSHKVVATETGIQQSDLTKILLSFCDQHQERAIELYCFDCKSAICMLCFVEIHKLHNCSNIDKVAEELQKTINDDVSHVEKQILKCMEVKETLANRRTTFNKHIQELQASVVKKGDAMKSLIDNHTDSILQELASVKKANLKEIENVQQELDREMVILESFKKYCDELKEKGSPCEIARVANDLHKRANELKESTICTDNYNSMDVAFNETDLQDLMKSIKGNLVGNILATNRYPEGLKVF